MNKTAIVTIGIVLALAVGGVVTWLVVTSNKPATVTTDSSSNTSSNMNTPSGTNSDNVPVNSGATSTSSSVTIENMAFSPSKITVKKGTTVTWTNKDDVGHSVVSDSDAPAGGPPKSAALFGNGGTFSFTYNTVGTFAYHCSAHPFMQGSVEVTE